MNQPSTDLAEQFLGEIVEWASAREDVVAAVLTGSRARGEAVDEFSDLDIELFTRDLSRYEGEDWLGELGEVMVCLSLEESESWTTRLVFFTSGVKVDFQLRAADHLDAFAAATPSHPVEDQAWGRGFRFLVDKIGAGGSIDPVAISAPARPSVGEDEFRRAVTVFWFEAAHIPRYLLRDELWVAKYRDWTMKSYLLQMIEWHARATSRTQNDGDDVDVWHIGTKMRGWADPHVWNDLQTVFGRFDRADSWRALLATADLFDRLAREVAEARGFEYPPAARVRAYIESFAPRFESDAEGGNRTHTGPRPTGF